jgi:hypothetical protein
MQSLQLVSWFCCFCSISVLYHAYCIYRINLKICSWDTKFDLFVWVVFQTSKNTVYWVRSRNRNSLQKSKRFCQAPHNEIDQIDPRGPRKGHASHRTTHSAWVRGCKQNKTWSLQNIILPSTLHFPHSYGPPPLYLTLALPLPCSISLQKFTNYKFWCCWHEVLLNFKFQNFPPVPMVTN